MADDLTGAMDTGAQLQKLGTRVGVVLDYSRIAELCGSGLFTVANTESRNVPPHEAYRRVAEALSHLSRSGIRLAYKKVDSTLRGNIGAELDAVIDDAPGRLVLVAPALPSGDRTTVAGKHYVDGIELAKTELASDPFAPVAHSAVADIVRDQSEREIGSLYLDTVSQGAAKVAHEIAAFHKRGIRIVVADAVDDTHLAALAQGARESGVDVLPCGSAGMFGQVARSYVFDNVTVQERETGRQRFAHAPRPTCPDPGFIDSGFCCNASLRADTAVGPKHDMATVKPVNRPNAPSVGEPLTAAGPALVICGSPSLVSKAQIAVAEDVLGATVVRLDETSLFGGDDARQRETSRAIAASLMALRGENHTVVEILGPSKKDILEKYADVPELLREHSARLSEALSEIVFRVLPENVAGGLCVIGGDTAASILQKVGTFAVEIVGEVEPLVPSGLLIGGLAGGLPIVTKAGGLGSPNAVVAAIRYLSGQGMFRM